MRTAAPSIAPLFRSEYQLRLLGELFVSASGPASVSEIGRRAGVPQPAASREIKRLAEHGIVLVEPEGRNRLVRANPALPWFRELRSLLAQTIGPPALLAVALADVVGVEAAFIFGSWAARMEGEPGAFPRDIDVAIVGTPRANDVYRACRTVERELKVDVNPFIVTPTEWTTAADATVVRQIRDRPLVELTLRRGPA